jgi:hypothetical protein
MAWHRSIRHARPRPPRPAPPVAGAAAVRCDGAAGGKGGSGPWRTGARSSRRTGARVELQGGAARTGGAALEGAAGPARATGGPAARAGRAHRSLAGGGGAWGAGRGPPRERLPGRQGALSREDGSCGRRKERGRLRLGRPRQRLQARGLSPGGGAPALLPGAAACRHRQRPPARRPPRPQGGGGARADCLEAAPAGQIRTRGFQPPLGGLQALACHHALTKKMISQLVALLPTGLAGARHSWLDGVLGALALRAMTRSMVLPPTQLPGGREKQPAGGF